MLTGASEVLNRADVYTRMSLCVPEFELQIPQRGYDIYDRIDEMTLTQVFRDASSPWILRCIREFASIEGDCNSSNRKGLGRVSSETIPRLGALLYKEAKKGKCDTTLLQAAIERSIHAGYIAMVALSSARSLPILRGNHKELWDFWIPISYSVPEEATELVFNNCHIDAFWSHVLRIGGFKKSLKELQKGESQYSEVANSIGNLCCTGIGLFVAERTR